MCDECCHNINVNLVNNAIKKLNKGKSDENYELMTDHLINAPKVFNIYLSATFNGMLIHGYCNQKFYRSVIKPIPKNKRKSLNDSTNYRAISINSVYSKVFDYVILELIGPKLKTSEVQFAYKSEFSTTMCSFLVGETIQYFRNNGSSVFALLLDASKAFDKVKYSKLFKILRARDICPLILRLLFSIYALNSAIESWNNVKSTEFNVRNGVKQGGVISPHLFTVYVEPLIKNLRESRLGCHVGPLTSNAFMYADDIIILSPTLFALCKLVIICEDYAQEYLLAFNTDKCYLLIFSDNASYLTNRIEIRINGVLIKIVDTEKHLGNNLTIKRKVFEFKDTIGDMKARTNSIVNNFSNISYSAKIMLFNSQCLALYGVQLWDLRDSDIEVLIVTWRKCVRYLLSLPYRTSSYLIPHIMNTCNILDIIMERQMNFYITMYNHKSKFIHGHTGLGR